MEPIIFKEQKVKLKEYLQNNEWLPKDGDYEFFVNPDKEYNWYYDTKAGYIIYLNGRQKFVLNVNWLDGKLYMLVRNFFVNRIDFIEERHITIYDAMTMTTRYIHKCKVIFTISEEKW